MNRKLTIVVDCGSRWCRAGFEGDSEVRLRIPTLVGKGKAEDDSEATYVGDMAQNRRETLASLSSPIVNGVVNDWDAMERVWQHTFFDQLKVEDLAEHAVLLTETPLAANKCRERTGELLLEKMGAAGVFVESQPSLAAYAAGKLNAVVAHLGHEYAQTAVIYEGYALRHAGALLEVGGNRVTDHLLRLLAGSDGNEQTILDKYSGRNAVEELKEAVCYVALDYDQEMVKSKAGDTLVKRHKLPDGQTIEVNEERFTAPEILFRPYLFGEADNDSGIHSNISRSISQSNIDIRKELQSNIVLSGGNSKFEGLQDRIAEEVKVLSPGGAAKIKVSAKVNREDFVFLGGAILSAMGPSFQKMYITKQQLEESGSKIFHQKT